MVSNPNNSHPKNNNSSQRIVVAFPEPLLASNLRIRFRSMHRNRGKRLQVNHNALSTLIEKSPNNLTWSYYAPPGTATENGNTIWTAPNALSAICGTVVGNGNESFCSGGDFANHVMLAPRVNGNNYDYAPILSDIASCSLLANVTWVTPDGAWSDHPGTDQGRSDGGPSWVAQIVDAVGAHSGTSDCTNGSANWENTVILITWDDWGGFYDHILPYNCPASTGCTGYTNSNGNGQYYVYGFRVPLLVVSAYTSKGYISGNPNNHQGDYPPYIHDFGSILGFVETVFNLPFGGIGPSGFPFADYFAPDGPKNPNCSGCSPLADFFNFNKGPNGFTSINTSKYPARCFHTPTGSGCFPNWTPSDPDNDGIDRQD